MSVWQQWIRRPQSLWLRKAIFQIHLWTGLALALYIIMLSVTGSILVYRVELSRAFLGTIPDYDEKRPRLSPEELEAAALRAYPGGHVTYMSKRLNRQDPVVKIDVDLGAEKKERRFDPYTGADLGENFPPGVRAVGRLADLHNDLMFGKKGRLVNGVGSAVVSLLALSGIVVWWPGIRNWRRSLIVKRRTNWRRFNWDLHSAMGVWFFLVLVLWGVSGIYFAFPELFMWVVDRISGSGPSLGTRPADVAIEWMVRLHFGRFRNAPYLQPLWVMAGLAPLGMAITGVLMWWNRVVRKRLRTPSIVVRQEQREVA